MLVTPAFILTAAVAPAAAQTPAPPRTEAQSRYHIAQMERLLEGAVEHGLAVTRDRVQALAQVPADLLVSDNAHARGFRLEGYGVFFDVTVPSFLTTLTWSLKTLDQNDLGLESALNALRSAVNKSGDVNLEQAYKRVELQVNPNAAVRAASSNTAGARLATGSAAAANGDPAAPSDPILNDPNEAYRTEVTDALKDAMLEHSSPLNIAPNEWLTIAAKGNDDRPQLAPADSDARTRILRLRGSDLADYLARKISKEQALERIEVRVF
jgi:hypothetical protein